MGDIETTKPDDTHGSRTVSFADPSTGNSGPRRMCLLRLLYSLSRLRAGMKAVRSSKTLGRPMPDIKRRQDQFPLTNITMSRVLYKDLKE